MALGIYLSISVMLFVGMYYLWEVIGKDIVPTHFPINVGLMLSLIWPVTICLLVYLYSNDDSWKSGDF